MKYLPSTVHTLFKIQDCGCERTGSDSASDKRQNCRLSLALSLENLGVRTGSVRATNRYGIIYIGICHIYYNMTSYLLGYGIISYILEYGIIFIGIWHHINWNMLSYLFEYIIILSGIYYHIY